MNPQTVAIEKDKHLPDRQKGCQETFTHTVPEQKRVQKRVARVKQEQD